MLVFKWIKKYYHQHPFLNVEFIFIYNSIYLFIAYKDGLCTWKKMWECEMELKIFTHFFLFQKQIGKQDYPSSVECSALHKPGPHCKHCWPLIGCPFLCLSLPEDLGARGVPRDIRWSEKFLRPSNSMSCHVASLVSIGGTTISTSNPLLGTAKGVKGFMKSNSLV